MLKLFSDQAVLPGFPAIRPRFYFSFGWKYIDKILDFYLQWLQAVVGQCNANFTPDMTQMSHVYSNWVNIGQKMRQIEILYNQVRQTCHGLESYNLQGL